MKKKMYPMVKCIAQHAHLLEFENVNQNLFFVGAQHRLKFITSLWNESSSIFFFTSSRLDGAFFSTLFSFFRFVLRYCETTLVLLLLLAFVVNCVQNLICDSSSLAHNEKKN